MTEQKIITPNYEWYTYDTEVFAYDFIVVFKNKRTGEYSIFHNDNEGVRDFISDYAIYCGFNSKGYDQYILKAICSNHSPEEVKQVNDWIIGGGQGWECPLLNGIYFRFNNVDIMDDMQMGLSLKAIEGHLGLDIEETEVDFNLDRPLTPEEIALTIKYCKHDVDCTERLTDLRENYLTNKIYLGGLKGVDEVKALSMTNAKLTALYLDAMQGVKYTDEREYKYPDNLLRDYIPDEVFYFFDRLYDPDVTDEVLFKSKLNLTVGGCPVTLGFGGIHGAIPFYQEEEQNGRIIRNYDVASYYPHLMTICGYTSRNIPNPQIYADMLETRMKAKKAGDTATANALKLVANTTYGAMLNKHNNLFDPLMGRSVCISGQLFLLELSEHLIAECSTLRIVQLNTDGIMVSFDESEYDKVLTITQEWQERTGFELEEDKIKSIAQKDVNNYVEIPCEGKPKIKGGYLVRGIAPAGAFNINNNATIVAKAIVDYFTKGTKVQTTIGKCNDIFQFQLIAKAGAKYREAYHLVDGKPESIQKVNRVYATADERYGKLFKVKAENDATAKIEMLPEHCIIDNDNHLTIDAVDKTFYIEMARKRINDFLGIKPEKIKKEKGEKQMASTVTPKDKTMNVYQKLLKARAKFLGSDAKKSGKNMHLAFKYFELDDIVPIATKIFEEVGLISIASFTDNTATMTIINTDNGEESITFSAPFNQIAPIVSSTGKQATNEMQALGSSITYMRRYLYMIALDICEPDSIDPMVGDAPKSTPTVAAPVQTPAPTPAPTATPTIHIVTQEKPLTSGNGNASDTQIRQLKDLLIKLKEKDPSKEEMIAQIAIQTQGFAVISKADCETLVIKIGEMLNAEGK